MPRRPVTAVSSSGAVQLFRSVPASALSFGLDFLVLATLVEFAGLSPAPATAASFAAGTGLNYLLCASWIFPRGRAPTRAGEALAFFASSGLGLALNAGGMALLAGAFGLPYLLARVVAGASVFAANFAMRKFLVFGGAALAPGRAAADTCHRDENRPCPAVDAGPAPRPAPPRSGEDPGGR